jgi:hypothetical protein
MECLEFVMSSTIFDSAIARSARVARQPGSATRRATRADPLMAVALYVAIGLTAGAIAIPAALATGAESAMFAD